MKSLTAALIIAFTIFISGCSTVQPEGLSIKLTADPPSALSGSNVVLTVDVDNRNDRAIYNVHAEVFDQGTLLGDKCEKTFDRLLAYEFQSITCSFNAPVVFASASTEVNALASFSTRFSASELFSVMTEGEYQRRRATGDYTAEPKIRSYSDRYVQITAEFSEAPPLAITKDKKYFVYFTITNIGNGFLENIKPGDFRLLDANEDKASDIVFCPETSELTPVGKKFPRIACEIRLPDDYLSTRSFRSPDFVMQLDYGYELRDDLKIDVIK